VDVVLSSGYARAWQTAELLDEVAGWPSPDECEALEPGRDPEQALDVLRKRDERSVGLVGHEPHLSRLASYLCTGSEERLRLEVKKGAVVVLEFDGDVLAGSALLRWSLAPKILRALGG
jgi:phosphohistidine phosphatase